MRKVVAVMHEHGISQMPVVGADGSLVGLIEEVDLLNHMLEEHDHNQSEPIDPLVQNASAVFPTETSLEEAMPSLKSGLALIVVENSRPVGILTKIDVLDYVAGKI
jgi:cystathionine beta-synthase